MNFKGKISMQASERTLIGLDLALLRDRKESSEQGRRTRGVDIQYGNTRLVEAW